jgi:hypothetical protein
VPIQQATLSGYRIKRICGTSNCSSCFLFSSCGFCFLAHHQVSANGVYFAVQQQGGSTQPLSHPVVFLRILPDFSFRASQSMPLFKMARESAPPKDGKDKTSKNGEKPLPQPDERPGTSGTELLLVTNRRRASERYQQAQRAERTYIAKKRSEAAKTNLMTAKEHFGQSFHHLKQGFGLSFAVVRSVPYYFSKNNEARRMKADERKKRRLAEIRKALEEELAREEARESNDTEAAKASTS